MTERRFNEGNPFRRMPSILRVEFFTWMRSLGDEADASDDLELQFKVGYVIAAHIAITEALEGKFGRSPWGQPLSALLKESDKNISGSEEPIYDEDFLPFATQRTAQVFFQEYPGSKAAEEIVKQGLEAPFGYHISLLMQIFKDDLEKRQTRN